MPYIIPNSSDTGSGQRFANINQAEPDSLDIEALGLRANWIRSGGVASVSGGGSPQVSVTAGVAVIGGIPYSFNALSATSLTPAAIGSRFDLIIVRLTAGVASIVVIAGPESTTNPTLPRSRSVVPTGTFNSSIHVDPDTDVLIASVYVTASAISSASLLDKRVVDPSPVVRQGTALPTNNTYDVIGDVVVYNNVVYVKKNSTTWDSVAYNSDITAALPPIGSIFAWPSTTNPGATYLECNGQTLLTASYPSLFALIGTTYGGNGTTNFMLPNISDDRFIMGSATGIGTTTGSNSATLVEANIPQHNHNVSVQSHGAYSHPNPTTSEHTGHSHQTNPHYHRGALMYRRPEVGYYNGRHITYDESVHPYAAYHVDVIDVKDNFQVDAVPGDSPYDSPKTVDAPYVDELFKFMTNSNPDTLIGGAHTHTLVISQHPEQAHTVAQTSFGSASPTAVSTTPKSIRMRWFIRAL